MAEKGENVRVVINTNQESKKIGHEQVYKR
jgi:hypothetical protein